MEHEQNTTTLAVELRKEGSYKVCVLYCTGQFQFYPHFKIFTDAFENKDDCQAHKNAE